MYEIVIESSERYNPWRKTFANRPKVVATAITREIACDIACGLMIMAFNEGFAGHPFEWDTLSVWDTDTDQRCEVYDLDEMTENDRLMAYQEV